jgi:hypothetical protein
MKSNEYAGSLKGREQILYVNRETISLSVKALVRGSSGYDILRSRLHGGNEVYFSNKIISTVWHHKYILDFAITQFFRICNTWHGEKFQVLLQLFVYCRYLCYKIMWRLCEIM